MSNDIVLRGEQLLADDLARSGIAPSDIGAYIAGEAELAAVGLRSHMHLQGYMESPGYVIPYQDAYGRRVPFYRVKLFNPLPRGAKYLQPSNSSARVYFPPQFADLLEDTAAGKSNSCINGYKPAVLIVEGEKKAVAGCAEGFLCVGLGGVYNWKSRTLSLPESVKIDRDEQTGKVTIKLPGDFSGDDLTAGVTSNLADGMDQLIEVIRRYDLQIVIAFDTDVPEKPEVLQACAVLAFELRSQGIPTIDIRALKLPAVADKVGLDDFLVQYGAEKLQEILHDTMSKRCAFPQHPHLRQYLNKRLGSAQSRNEFRELALSILADLDSRGMRMKDEGFGTPYYFSSETKSLLRVNLMRQNTEPIHESQFGELLYKNYDIGANDSRLISWLASAFTGEDPIATVSPRSVVCTVPNQDVVAFQISDGLFARVTADGIGIHENGTHGLMFKSQQIKPLNVHKLEMELKKQEEFYNKATFSDFWWDQCANQFKFLREQDKAIAAILMYVSPWLLRWRGTQLPIELMIGEPGSGKSSMYSLRLTILTGFPALRNQPTDVRDWYASVTSQDGLHVIDNVHFVSKELRQRLSDEMCRVTTEPNPTVEMRRLYTTSDNARIPVRTVFALTAIQQPFINADIIQRSFVFELGAVGKNHASDWVGDHLNGYGGREAWVAHQLYVLHKFFKLVKDEWNPSYRSAHRLANIEQVFYLMAKVLKHPNPEVIRDQLTQLSTDKIAETDWTMEGLKMFAAGNAKVFQRDPRKVFTCFDVSQWAEMNAEFQNNTILTDPRRLARYMKSHKTMVETLARIEEVGMYANRVTYRILPDA